jgi:hypothetical protein
MLNAAPDEVVLPAMGMTFVMRPDGDIMVFHDEHFGQHPELMMAVEATLQVLVSRTCIRTPSCGSSSMGSICTNSGTCSWWVASSRWLASCSIRHVLFKYVSQVIKVATSISVVPASHGGTAAGPTR